MSCATAVGSGCGAISSETLFVAHYASAEIGCHLALNWQVPARILDTFVEFRNYTNGLTPYVHAGLLSALSYFGLNTMGAAEKTQMRDLAMRGGPWTASEKEALLDYCEEDVCALGRLLTALAPHIDLERALLRGRAMAAAARMEFAGVPIDVPKLELLRRHWTDIQDDLVADIDQNYGVYDGRSFREDRFEVLITKFGIPWPRLESGKLATDKDTFREAAKTYPIISPLRELKSSLGELRLNDLEVGRDGRNRRILSAFQARTGRFQPSTSKFIFGPSVWLRGLIKPPLGYGISYVDYSSQEYGIAAALSADPAMQAAYTSGDPYLAFGKQIGALPVDATKETHEAERQLYKICILGVQYGMSEWSLARRINQLPFVASDLLLAHRRTYRKFWDWSDAAVDSAMLSGGMRTVFGWRVRTRPCPNPRMLRNFPMQSHGGEMLRLACCLATERGIEICAPVHDAVLICAPLDRLDADVAGMRTAMAEASRIVLDGFELRTDAKLVRYPDRYMDPRGRVMWDRVNHLVARRSSATPAIGAVA
jgi:DNA polymerase I